MIWTWLRAFLHPRGAAALINSQQEEIEGLRREVTNIRAEADTLSFTVMTSRETALVQARTIKNMEEELTATKRQLEEALEEQADLEELEKLITRFEEEKENYEKRILALRAHLKDARETIEILRNQDLDEIPEPLDLKALPTSIDNVAASDLKPDEPKESPLADNWLQQLPDNL